jgi:hypothetical protein
MFTADADFEIRLHTATSLRADADQLAYTFAVQHLKRIIRKNLALHISWQEPAGVVPA